MKVGRYGFAGIAVLLFQLSFAHQSALGQATNAGEISGLILDSARAIVTGANVKLTNRGTGFSRETVSNEHGLYAFPLLEPGDYELLVTRIGFKSEMKFSIAVQTHSKVVVNFALEPGLPTETVNVAAMGEVLKPTDVSVMNVVPQWQLKALPLNDKLLAEFTRLEAGVTPRELTTAESGPNSDSGGFIFGLRQFFVQVTLDGGHFDDPTWPGGTMTNTQGISFDAVKEFAIIKGNADATQASAAGYTINITTRSGTNAFHGDLFEYLRNNALDARNFFDGKNTQPLRRNQFGGAFSGPLPFRKQKDFFFANYEGFRRSLLQTVVSIVPTDRLLERVPGGPANGFLREIMTFTYLRPTPGTFAPNALVAPATGTANLGMDRDMFVARLDNELTPTNHALFRFNFINGDTAPGVSIRPGVRGGAVAFHWRFRNVLLGLNTLLSSRAVNELRFTYDRTLHGFTAEPTPPELVALGLDPTADTRNGLPFIFFAGTGLTGDGVLPFVPKRRHSNVFEVNDVFSMTSGNHNLKFGITVRRKQSHWLLGENTRPSTLFIGFGPPFDTSFFGITTGRFLSQTENLIVNPSTPIRGFRSTNFATFFQDTHRLTNKVTLIYGLRYSLDTPYKEVNNLLSNAYPISPSSGQPIADGDINNETLNNLAIRTVDQMPFYKFDKNNFAPNFGISWMPNHRLLLKAGYGITYGSPFIELIRLVGFNPPYGVSTVLRIAPFGTRPDQNQITVPPVLNVYNPSSVNPLVHYWNFTAERELEKNTVLRISYIGNRGANLWITRQPNFGSGFTGIRPNPNFSIINLTETKGRSNYNGVRLEVNRRFNQGFAIQGTYVFGKALDDISAAVSTLCPQGLGCLPTDQRSLRENYGRSDLDVRHTAVVNFIYELPFGKGRRFFNTTSPVSKLFGGWTISGIASYWNGLPFDVVSGVDNNGDGVTNDRARVIPGANPRDMLTSGGDKAQFLDPRGVGTILSPSVGTPLPRNFFRGPAIFNVDMSLQKSLNLSERVNLKLLLETFNIFNHTNLATPVNSLSSPAFGRIIATSTRSREIQLGLKLDF